MPFVADDLGAWLIGVLADAGRKKLTTLILGTDQERTLRSAATTAVRLTAEQLRPDDEEQAEYVARVISEVFSEPAPYAPLTGHETVLEALQAGIARQLAVVDDADLTSVGQSSADALGVPAGALAQKLTDHLLREIVVRGARGGPLEPLASQLNHDVTHLQGQRLEGKLDRLVIGLGRRGPGGHADSGTWLDVHDTVTERLLREAGRPTGPQHPFALLERKLEGHTNYVWDVIITPDGRRAISASNDRTAAQWDLSVGKRLCTYEGARSEVCSIAISSDSTEVVGGCLDGEVFVWDVNRPEPLSHFYHGAPDAKVDVCRDGTIITGGSDGILRRWRRGTVLSEVAAHDGAILKVVVLDNNDVVSVSEDRTAKVWSLMNGMCKVVCGGHTGNVNSVAVAASGRWLVTGSDDCSVRIWRLPSGICDRRLEGHCEPVWRVAIDRLDRLIASGSGDNTVRLWTHEGNLLDELLHPDCVAAVAFSPDSRRLVVGCDDARLYVYAIPSSDRL
jgi:hypothetical protein